MLLSNSISLRGEGAPLGLDSHARLSALWSRKRLPPLHDWFNDRRLLEPIGYIPPAEAEAHNWLQQNRQALLAA